MLIVFNTLMTWTITYIFRDNKTRRKGEIYMQLCTRWSTRKGLGYVTFITRCES